MLMESLRAPRLTWPGAQPYTNRLPAIRWYASACTLALFFFAPLCGCSNPESATRTIDADDPAMTRIEPAAAAIEVSEHTSAPAVPEGPRLDETGQKIFIPSLGWMPTREFMDIYENRPEQLPQGLDLYEIHKIREKLAGRG